MHGRTERTHPTKPRRPVLTPQELLNDPARLVVSVSQASECLGISRSTAHYAYRDTGFLTTGVPVLRVGRRCVVATAHLRTILGIADPAPDIHQAMRKSKRKRK